MALQSIAAEWENFQKKIFKGMKPSDVQRDETRKAFYAGATAMFRNLEEIGEPHISETAGMVFLSLVKKEIEKFGLELQEDLKRRN